VFTTVDAMHDHLMADIKQQYICVKFSLKCGKTALERHEMLKTGFREHATGRTHTSE
jgi:hypothetical protein